MICLLFGIIDDKVMLFMQSREKEWSDERKRMEQRDREKVRSNTILGT